MCLCHWVEYNNNNNNNNNITVIRSYATQAHGHKPYIQIHNTVINWENPNIHVHVKTNRKKTLHVQTEILRKKLIIHLNKFDYSQLHFCVRNFWSEIAQVWSVYLYWHQTRPELTLPKGGRVKYILSIFGFRPLAFSSSCEFLPSENRLCHFKTNAWVTSLCYGVVCIILNVSVWLLNILGQLYGRNKTGKKGFQDLINRLYIVFSL